MKKGEPLSSPFLASDLHFVYINLPVFTYLASRISGDHLTDGCRCHRCWDGPHLRHPTGALHLHRRWVHYVRRHRRSSVHYARRHHRRRSWERCVARCSWVRYARHRSSGSYAAHCN